jgi:hypothetical protein
MAVPVSGSNQAVQGLPTIFERHSTFHLDDSWTSSNIDTNMAVTLGKRKRTSRARNDVWDSDSDDVKARALFQRAFEARFKPLSVEQRATNLEVSKSLNDEPETDESDWDGFENDGEGTVQVVDHGGTIDNDEILQREEFKAFMVRLVGRQRELRD